MTLQEQYNLIKEGKGHKGIFLTEAKKQFPNMLTNPMGFEEASKMLKTRGVLSENYVDLKPINTIEASPKTAWENKFAQFLAEEAKAVEKKPTAEVEEIESHNYDYEDQTNLDNQIGQEVLNGLYFEGRENPDKTLDELRKMVAKNLAKDRQYYMKNAAFGVEGLGYKETELEEVSGKYASSGYSDKLKKVVKESLSESKESGLAKMGYSASDIEDLMDEWKNGGVKLPKKVKDYLEDNGTKLTFTLSHAQCNCKTHQNFKTYDFKTNRSSRNMKEKLKDGLTFCIQCFSHITVEWGTQQPN
jgi:Holliday junction resolvasome RuvABC DNA-binding subunit